MTRRSAWIGLGLLACQAGALGTAAAQAPGSAVTAAAVDALGRVLPVRGRAAPSNSGETGLSAPCSGGAALPREAAKELVGRIATEEDFYPDFVLSVAKVESRYDSTALSDKGAYGLMQLMPDTARRFGVDRCDPAGNVRGGIRYLKALHARYRNPFFILAAYNAGEEAVRRGRGVPPFPETVRFVADVMNDFYAWPNPAGEKAPVPSLETPSSVARAAERPPAATPSDAAGPVPTAQAARWDSGFVLHVD